jgi:shikimate kinase / 3-dehydroquinate synthase
VRRNVVLIGFMGTGKTAVGREVAARTARPFVDTDTLIEDRAGRPIHRIFAEDGEPAFRRLEAEVVASVSDRDGIVIATGGGVVLRADNMANLRRRGIIVALVADPQIIMARVGGGGRRPLLEGDPEERIRHLHRERDPLYRDADLVIDTSGLSPQEATDSVLAFLAERDGPPQAPDERIVPVPLGARAYEIRIGQGVIQRAADALRGRGLGGRLALLTHPVLADLYGNTLAESLRAAGWTVPLITVPPAESSKSLRVAARVYDALVEARLDRSSALLVLGGGVAGDLGGFVAATFLRGIAWAILPTTLLAQVDAAIGGKTAVNHSRAKNLIGAVHQPALVLADIDTLRTLPRRELRSGLSEVIKTAVIGPPDLFRYLEENLPAALDRRPETLLHIVSRCAEFKASVVAADERETAGRIVLNYGHTIGHGIEAAAGYRGLTHGEAIAVGMTLEARLAVRLGLCDPSLLDRQTRLLETAGLPVRVEQLRPRHPIDPRTIAAAIGHDKKVLGGRVRFVLPTGIGHTAVRDDVPPPLLEEALADG